MMVDGCGKLDVRQLQDVLKRLMITSSLRLLPASVRGFPFLTYLKQHMKSYKPDDFDAPESGKTLKYPILKKSDGHVSPQDSTFDKPSESKKRKIYNPTLSEPNSQTGDENVRKYHKKF